MITHTHTNKHKEPSGIVFHLDCDTLKNIGGRSRHLPWCRDWAGHHNSPVYGPRGGSIKIPQSSSSGNARNMLFSFLLFNSQQQMLMMIHSYLQKKASAFKSSTMFSHPCDHGSSTFTRSVLSRVCCKKALMCSNQTAKSTH